MTQELLIITVLLVSNKPHSNLNSIFGWLLVIQINVCDVSLCNLDMLWPRRSAVQVIGIYGVGLYYHSIASLDVQV